MATVQEILGQSLPVGVALGLGDLLSSYSERNKANAAAQASSADYESLFRALTGGMNQIDPLVQQLMQQLMTSGDPMAVLDEDAIHQREMQRFSALVPSVDRAAALTSSQGYAQALRSGMANSTQAAGQADELTRKFGDVYAKLQENARTTAFGEAMEKFKSMMNDRSQTQSSLNSAITAMQGYASGAQRIAGDRASNNAAAKASSAGAFTTVLDKLLNSQSGKALVGKADSYVKDALGLQNPSANAQQFESSVPAHLKPYLESAGGGGWDYAPTQQGSTGGWTPPQTSQAGSEWEWTPPQQAQPADTGYNGASEWDWSPASSGSQSYDANPAPYYEPIDYSSYDWGW